jgi:hypothetical protein
MNELCASIQEESDYDKFATMLREMSDLIERKEQRRFPKRPKIVWTGNKPWMSMSAVATKILPSFVAPRATVEISIPDAADLYREIRIENQFTGVVGERVSVSVGARLQLTLEVEATDAASAALQTR